MYLFRSQRSLPGVRKTEYAVMANLGHWTVGFNAEVMTLFHKERWFFISIHAPFVCAMIEVPLPPQPL